MLLQVILNPDLQQTTLCVAEHDLHNDFSVILSLPLKKEISNNFIQNFIAYDEFNFSYLDDEYFWLENISVTKNILAILNAADFIELTLKDLEYIDKIAANHHIEINEFENLGYQSPIKTIPRNLSSKPNYLDKFIAIGDKSPKLLHTCFYFENNDITFIVNKRKINSYQFFHHLNSNFDRIRFKNSLTIPFADESKLVKFITSLDYFVEKELETLEEKEEQEDIDENFEELTEDTIENDLVENQIDESDEYQNNNLIDNIDNQNLLNQDINEELNSEINIVNTNEEIINESLEEIFNDDLNDENITNIIVDENVTLQKNEHLQLEIIDFIKSFSFEKHKTVNAVESKPDNHIESNIFDSSNNEKSNKFDNDIKSLEDRFYDFFNDNSSDQEFFLEPIKNITDEDIKEQIREFQKNNPVELKNKNDILKNIKKINVENKPEPTSVIQDDLPIEDIVNYINDAVDESAKLNKEKTHIISLFNFIISAKIKKPIDESFLNEWQEISLEDEIDKVGDDILDEVKEEVSIFENIVQPVVSKNVETTSQNILLENELHHENKNNTPVLKKASSCFVYYIDFISDYTLTSSLSLDKKETINIHSFINSSVIQNLEQIQFNETISDKNEDLTSDETIVETISDKNEDLTSDETIVETISDKNEDLTSDETIVETISDKNEDLTSVEIIVETISDKNEDLTSVETIVETISETHEDLTSDEIIVETISETHEDLTSNETIVETISETHEDLTSNETIVETISDKNEDLTSDEPPFSSEEQHQKLIDFAMNNDLDSIKKLYQKYSQHKKSLIDFNHYGDNPLCIASFKENIDLVKFLIEQGWNPNYFDANLNNALIIAAAEGHKHIVRYLLSHKVQINFKNKKGYTALHFAVNDCNHRIVKLLLEAGSDVNAQDNDKNTPLSIASFKGDINSTKLLLKTHINVHLKNKQGYDARSIAIISKNNAIAKLIEEKIVNDKNNVNLPPIIEKNV